MHLNSTEYWCIVILSKVGGICFSVFTVYTRVHSVRLYILFRLHIYLVFHDFNIVFERAGWRRILFLDDLCVCLFESPYHLVTCI